MVSARNSMSEPDKVFRFNCGVSMVTTGGAFALPGPSGRWQPVRGKAAAKHAQEVALCKSRDCRSPFEDGRRSRLTGSRAGHADCEARRMKAHRLLLPLCLVAVSCDRDEPIPLREGHAYLQPSGPGLRPDLEQRIPQGAQATGDAVTRR